MSDEEQRPTTQQAGEPAPVHSYASPIKRVWAWVGVVYMMIITCLVTYFLAHGSFLNGVGSLMLCPALAGIAAAAVVNYKTGHRKGGLTACIAITALAAVLLFINLVLGVPALIVQFGG